MKSCFWCASRELPNKSYWIENSSHASAVWRATRTRGEGSGSRAERIGGFTLLGGVQSVTSRRGNAGRHEGYFHPISSLAPLAVEVVIPVVHYWEAF
jgi:hypothetical protein